RVLAGSSVVAGENRVVLVQLNELAAVPADGHAGVGLYEPVNGHCTLLARGNGVDGEAGAGVHVAAHKHVRLGGLIGQRVCLGPAAATQLHGAADEQPAPLDALADAHEHPVTGYGHGILLVVDRGEAAVCVGDR